jgi:hypothetical protein
MRSNRSGSAAPKSEANLWRQGGILSRFEHRLQPRADLQTHAQNSQAVAVQELEMRKLLPQLRPQAVNAEFTLVHVRVVK